MRCPPPCGDGRAAMDPPRPLNVPRPNGVREWGGVTQPLSGAEGAGKGTGSVAEGCLAAGLSAVVLQRFEPLTQQPLAPLDHPLLIALEHTARRAELHRPAEGDVPDGVQPAELTPLPGRHVLQQLAAEAAVAGAVFPLPAAGAQVLHEHPLALPLEGLIGEPGERHRVEADRRGLNSPAPHGHPVQDGHKEQGAEQANQRWVFGGRTTPDHRPRLALAP